MNPGQSSITATANRITGTATLTVSNATIVSIAINPPQALSAPGSKRQYKAIATLSDTSTQDVTSLVVWSSNNADVLIANDNLGPNKIGQARISLAATTGTTATLTATLGALPSTISNLNIGLFAYTANYSSTVSVFTINSTMGALTAGTAVGAGSSPASVVTTP